MKKIYFSLLIVSLLACQPQSSERKLYKLPSSTAEGVQVVIEIPAGTNEKIEYNTERKRFEVDSINGRSRVVNFLPYPGNYGFIPSTYMNPEDGGDGDALDVLVISNSVPTGTVMNVLPIASLQLRDREEIDTKIIAVPADSTARTLQVSSFTEFLIEYNMAKKIVEDWFIGYKGIGQIELIGWEDEKAAMQEIKRWAVE
ncbi:MAG: inorganic diphosphatase [Bacteroidota bacterium]